MKKLEAFPVKTVRRKVERGGTPLMLVVFIAIRTTPCNETCFMFSFAVFIAFKDDRGTGDLKLHLHGCICI